MSIITQVEQNICIGWIKNIDYCIIIFLYFYNNINLNILMKYYFIAYILYMSRNIEPSNDEYYKHSIYDYWILSSHNTYLPFDQYFAGANMCYYNLILNVFMGGCIEIDLYGIHKSKKDKNYDIKIRHAPINRKFLKLSKTLKKIVQIMKYKYVLKQSDKKLPIGPLIISFDNKDISFKDKDDINSDEQMQNIFWKVLNDNLLKYDNNNLCNSDLSKCPWIQIISDETLDYTKINLEDLDMKILLRGKEKQNFKRIITGGITGGSTKKMFIPPQHKIKGFEGYENIFNSETRWFHLSNTKLKSFEGLAVDKSGKQIKNMSESIASYGLKKLGGSDSKVIKDIEEEHKITYYAIENTKYNLIRIFPDGKRIKSHNYDNLGYLMNGCQLVALNFQVIDKPWFQVMAIFNPDFFTTCNENCESGKIQDIIAKKTHKLKSYVLKPKWLRNDGNILEYPEKHKITLNINIDISGKKDKYKDSKINVEIGINKKENIGYQKDIKIEIENINVTLPVLYIELLQGDNKYKGAYLLEWEKNNTNDTKKKIYLYKFKQNKHYNDIPTDIKDDDTKYDVCDTNAFFMHINKKIECTINYKWENTNTKIVIDNTNKSNVINPEEDEEDTNDVHIDSEGNLKGFPEENSAQKPE